MNKPFEILYREAKENLYNLINDSEIPVCCWEDIISNVLVEVQSTSKQDFVEISRMYEESLKKQEEAEKAASEDEVESENNTEEKESE